MDINGVRIPQQTPVVRGIAQGAATAAKTISVKFLGTTVTCRIMRGVPAIVAGDVVIATRQGYELVVVERLHSTAPSADTTDPASSYPPNPWVSIQTGTVDLRPVETRSFRDSLGWREDTDDTLQGAWGTHNHKGCAFYGNGPRALAGVEVLSATVQVKRPIGTSWSSIGPTTLKRFTEKVKPSGSTDVTFVSGTTDGPTLSQGETQNFTIPTAWAQELADGTAGGLAIYTTTGEPQARLAGRSTWSPAWTLTISWRRVV